MLLYGKSDIGKKRVNNEDYLFFKEIFKGIVLGIVCDGMGGAFGGEYASSGATNSFSLDMTEKIGQMLQENPEINDVRAFYSVLSDSAFNANEAVMCYAKALGREGMGTTLVACLSMGTRALVCNIGDSRAYHINSERILQITRDHSLVQKLLAEGIINKREADEFKNKNIITRAVGTDPIVEPDIFSVALSGTGDEYILLCSDGLCGQVSDAEIFSIVNTKPTDGTEREQNLIDKVKRLIARANEAGGPDNITVVLIKPVNM